MDVSGAILMSSGTEFEDWLRANGTTERQVVVSLYKKSSGRQTVTLGKLQEAAICHGWIDNLGQRIDEDLWALRFVPRRPGSAWSATNRELARRLLSEGRMTPAGIALLPPDL